MIGIYKITSPSGRIYVGQSINIKKRYEKYKSLHCKSQIKLYNSFIKYGVKNHKFEIIEKCEIYELNNKERYWQDFYDVIGSGGLNCILVNTFTKKRIMSEETKKKISENTLGRIISDDTKLKMSKFQKGKITSEETKLKISIANKGKPKNRIIKIKPKYKVINIITNEIFNSVYEAADKYNIQSNTLYQYLSGRRKNKTTLKYLNYE